MAGTHRGVKKNKQKTLLHLEHCQHHKHLHVSVTAVLAISGPVVVPLGHRGGMTNRTWQQTGTGSNCTSITSLVDT